MADLTVSSVVEVGDSSSAIDTIPCLVTPQDVITSEFGGNCEGNAPTCLTSVDMGRSLGGRRPFVPSTDPFPGSQGGSVPELFASALPPGAQCGPHASQSRPTGPSGQYFRRPGQGFPVRADPSAGFPDGVSMWPGSWPQQPYMHGSWPRQPFWPTPQSYPPPPGWGPWSMPPPPGFHGFGSAPGSFPSVVADPVEPPLHVESGHSRESRPHDKRPRDKRPREKRPRDLQAPQPPRSPPKRSSLSATVAAPPVPRSRSRSSSRSSSSSRSPSRSRSRSRSPSRSSSRSRSRSPSPPNGRAILNRPVSVPPISQDSSAQVSSEAPHPRSIAGALSILKAVRPELIAEREASVLCKAGSEFLLGQAEPNPTLLVAKQSPFISSLIASLSRELRGESGGLVLPRSSAAPPSFSLVHNDRGPLPDLPPIGPKALKTNSFFLRSKSSYLLDKSSLPLLDHTSLPQHPLILSDVCRSVLSRSAAANNGSQPFTLAVSDKRAQDWEELARRGLESASFADSVLNVVSANSIQVGAKGSLSRPLSDVDHQTLVWSLGRSIESMADCLGRLYFNIILARRDAYLAKASARIPPNCLPRIRALPLDQVAIFGPQVAGTVAQANATAVTDQFLSLPRSRPSHQQAKQPSRAHKRKAPYFHSSPPASPKRSKPSSRPRPKKDSRKSSKGPQKGTGHPQ